MHRLIRAILALLWLVPGAALAAEAQQGPPDFGVDTSGTFRNLNLRDATLSGSGSNRVPMGFVDTTTHNYYNTAVLPTLTGATNYHPRIAPAFIRTQGYSVVGTGGALYRQETAQPTHAFKFSITTSPAGATVWYGIAPSERPVNFEQLGAISGDALDDKAAIQAALDAGINPISGLGKSYQINGGVFLRNGNVLQDATFVETAAGVVRLITSDCSGPGPTYPSCAGPFTLRRVKVDRGTSTTGGTIADSAGIWLSNAQSVLFEDVEVTGNGAGTGMRFPSSQNVKLVRPWVHDMEWSSTVDPGIEQMVGITCGGDNCVITDMIIENLWGTIPWSASTSLSISQGKAWRTNAGNAYRAQSNDTTGSVAPACSSGSCSDGGVTWDYMGPAATTKRAYQADGLAASQVNGLTVRGGRIQNVWEGSDIGYSNDVWFYNVVYKDIDSWGQKWCHGDLNSGSIGTRVIRAGLAGITICGGEGGAHHRIIDAIVIDAGSNKNWAGGHAGYWVLGETNDDQFINTQAIDTQAVHTMTSGYHSEAVTTGPILVNPYAVGYVNVARSGLYGSILEAPFLVGGTSGHTVPYLDAAQNVFGNTSQQVLQNNGARTIPLALVNAGGAAGGEVAMDLSPNNNPPGVRSAQIASVSASGTSDANLVFRTANGDVPTARMVIASGGGVVIPQTNPGNASIALGLFNGGGTPNTEVILDLSPTNNPPGGRSAQVASVSPGGGDANLVFRTASGAVPATRMTIAPAGGVTVGAPTGGALGAGTLNAQNLYLNGTVLGTAALAAAGASGHALPYLDAVNTFSARQQLAVNASGASTIPLALSNGANAVSTEVCMDLAPNTAGAGGRSAQVCSVASTAGSDANLVFRTANGTAPTQGMALGKHGSGNGGLMVGQVGQVTDPGIGSIHTQWGIQLGVVTIASLPACAAALEGFLRGVTDANATTYNAVAAGGGSNHMPVYCDGTNWRLH